MQGRLFDKLDANHDGQLTADEIPTAKRGLFERLLRLAGKTPDGRLSRDEFITQLKTLAPAQPEAEDKARRRFLDRIEANGDTESIGREGGDGQCNSEYPAQGIRPRQDRQTDHEARRSGRMESSPRTICPTDCRSVSRRSTSTTTRLIDEQELRNWLTMVKQRQAAANKKMIENDAKRSN